MARLAITGRLPRSLKRTHRWCSAAAGFPRRPRALARNGEQWTSAGVPSTGRHVERTLIDALLLGHAHSHLQERDRPAAPAVPVAIARAVDLLHEHPAEPWSSITLARADHVSVRSLQGGFHKHVGKPPMTYLRDLRLRGIHEDLKRATPVTTTVESVAYSWGMVHMGRFAAAYRRALGEVPSQMLRRPAK
jgi:transcriptional regulator GlxA family with amidase domain